MICSSDKWLRAGLVLASGFSRRFGGGNKLLAAIDGEPMIRRTVRAYLEAGLDPVLVVVGHEAERVADALDGLSVAIVPNPDYRKGQSRALVRGIEALPEDAGAAVIGVGDQPFLPPGLIADMVDRYRQLGAPIVAPRHAGRRINPTLFARSLFPELLTVTGDRGGKPVLERHQHDITWIKVDDPMVGMDIDTPDDIGCP